ncbi:MAG: hypothetical protein QM831_42980 [Kofleriaceae bacterium]
MSNKPDTPGLTFQEKSLWVQLVSTVVIYAVYFVLAVRMGEGDPRVGVLFVGTVIAMAVVNAVVHAVLAVMKRPEKADERDRQISLRATKYSYAVLTVGVWCALTVCAMTLGTFWIAHVGLAAFILAEIVRFASQLVFYKRGFA